MKKNINIKSNILLLLGLVLLISNCKREPSLDIELATFPKNGNVFIDGFSAGLEYLPFGDSYFEAFSVDEETKYNGSAAMRFDVPNVGNPDGAYAGAIFPDNGSRDLSDFDALTFWAKSTKAGKINDIGFGQDFGENKYQVSLSNLQLSTNWQQYTIAIPDASKLTREKGLFWYAEGPENDEGYTFWIDELQFEKLGNIGQPRPSIMEGEDVTIQTFIGVSTAVSNLNQTFNLGNGQDQTITCAPAYFTFISSNPSVATVNDQGQVTAIGTGSTVITAELNGIAAVGSLTIDVTGNFDPAPTPTQDPINVISIFSDTYTNQPVDFFNGFWAPFQTTIGQDDININGDNVITYAELNFVGIQFAVDAPTINASSMTHFHLDVQPREDVEAGDFLTIRIVDAGPDNTIGSGDDTSGEITLDNSNLVNGEWYSIDVPFSDLGGLANRSNLGQIVFVSDATISNIFVDNIYFYNDGNSGSMGLSVAAPTPTQNASDVISVFSDAYTNIDGSDFNPDWGQATMVTEMIIDGSNTLRYAGLDYQGLQLGSAQDLTSMEFLHIDYWTENSSALNAFLISGNATEVAKVLNVPTSGWASVDIPLGDFSPVDLADIIQFKFDGNGDIYLDNIYFYKTPGGGGGVPTVAAPIPTQNATDVISVFSDTYTNIMGSDLNPDWGQATQVSEVDIAGNNTLFYEGLNYQGLQLGSAQDVISMEFLHIDYWTENSMALNTFLISGNATEVAKVLNVPTSGWASVDIPLGDFSPVDLADIIQFKFDGNGDIYLDNIYFYKTTTTAESSLPLTFEDGFNPVIAFDGGATAEVVDNPDPTGNTSAKVLQFNKVVGAAWYSGIVFDDALSTTPLIDLSTGTVFTVKIWSPTAGVNVRFQLEGGTAPAYEVFQTVSDANQWVTLTFDFTSQVNASDTYPKFSLFPDFDTGNQNPVTVEAIYYIDDITQQ